MSRLFKFLIRISSFLSKELTEIFRQPRLILTLILGPFLIMLLFGIAYPKQTRPLRTIFVAGEQNPIRDQVEAFAQTMGQTIIFEGVESDKTLALTKLALNKVDMVIVVPEDPMTTIQNNQQARFEVYHNEVDPYQVGYVRFVASEMVDVINRGVLQTLTEQGQEDAGTVQSNLKSSIANAHAIKEALTAGDMATAIAKKQELDTNLDFVRLAVGTTLGMYSSMGGTAGTSAAPQNGQEVQASLNEVDQSVNELGDINANATPEERTAMIERVSNVEEKLTQLDEKLTLFRSVEPRILVSPFSYKTAGLAGVEYTPTEFFSVAVIVLLLQHLSVTFAALSIVRERRSGIMELFKVSPINAFEALIGKFISYMVFEALLSAVITMLVVYVLKVPMLGNWWDYIGALAILSLGALGFGFLISLIADTEIQAAQYSMLFLLASIFFSGFFMDLRLMWPPLKVLAWSLPATYGITMLQDVMLRGYPAPLQVTLGISLIAVVLFIVDWFLLRRKMESY